MSTSRKKFEVTPAAELPRSSPSGVSITITPADHEAIEGEVRADNNDKPADRPHGVRGDGNYAEKNTEVDPLAATDENNRDKSLYLFEEDMKTMPTVTTFLRNIRSYHTFHPSERDSEVAKNQPKRAKLGTILGVYLPTIQHIFGVIMFVRLAWMVGCGGFIETFVMVAMCCVCTFFTAISMSAIATNGVVQAGGSYFMISRNLGPECGGAVGICFYLANTFATCLYILGSVEMLLIYMTPQLAVFGDMHKDPDNNIRLYGSCILVLLSVVVAFGVRFVAIFAPFSLACVIVSILCLFIGGFEASGATRDIMICLLGDRLLSLEAVTANGTVMCNKTAGSPVFDLYCSQDNGSTVCDPYFVNNDLRFIPGIPGIASGVMKDNLFNNYLQTGEASPGVQGDHHRGEIVADVATSFVILAGIYFPSVTGIMTGSNMSGDLKDPQKSIPTGTIMAQLTTSFVYLALVALFSATTEGALLRDKFGESLGGNLLAAGLAWPHPWVILVGGFCSTIGAALQCLTSAPRLLQAIARDNVVPFLDVFKVTLKNGEPIRALIVTTIIAELGILIAKIEYVAPVIDVFFLMCYLFVNVACALQTLLRTPNWRPRFRYYHWSLSIIGVVLCLALAIFAGWYYALSAFLIAAFIYKYVEYKGGEKEWGDGINGFSMSAARHALLKLDEGPTHTKNWRPQLLVLCKLTDEFQPKYRRMLSFARQLKHGKGLTVVGAVLKGKYRILKEDTVKAKEVLEDVMNEEKVKGFVTVMAANSISDGLEIFVHTAGLGGMRPNTVVVGWPYGWKESSSNRTWSAFLDTVRAVAAADQALLVPRGIDNFPDDNDRLHGNIDVWWVVHDGGMLLLISFLLQQHRVWRNCKLRIFTVAQIQDNSIQLKKDLENFLYQLRINAEVFVEEMNDSVISAYTVERTVQMQKRANLYRQLSLTQREYNRSVQFLVDRAHSSVGIGLDAQSPPSKNESLTLTPPLEEHPSTDAVIPDSPPPGVQFHLEIPGSDGASPHLDPVHFTFTKGGQNSRRARQEAPNAQEDSGSEGKLHLRMHTAVQLNEIIRGKSQDSQLVILNFPSAPQKLEAEENYMEYLEVLTEGLLRVLMVRGAGNEVVTIYS